MSVIRNKITKKFTTIPNLIIIDSKLSHGAFRVYSYLLSKPDGWKVINADIQEQLNIKQAQTLANYWKELISSGWISRHRLKDKEGKIIGGYDYELNEYPVLHNMEATISGNNHNMENPQYGKSINRENPHSLNNTKGQEQNKTEPNNTNPPNPLLIQEPSKTKSGIIGEWLNQVEYQGCQFTDAEIQAINAWASYKTAKAETISIQQIDLTLKSLAAHKTARYDIVYMIHQSITGGYRKIMDPTNACIAKPAAKVVNCRYQAQDYIIPQTQAEKNDLWNYLKCSYMNKNDPRTGQPMTNGQISHIGKHFKRGLSQGINQDRYIYLNEAETGVSLLEQAIG